MTPQAVGLDYIGVSPVSADATLIALLVAGVVWIGLDLWRGWRNDD